MHRLRSLFATRLSSLKWFGPSVLLGGFCALIIYSAVALGWLNGLERGTLDALFKTRGVRYPYGKIVIVVVDDATVERYRQWPLPRHVYSELVDHLTKAGAKTIAFDILFPAHSTPWEDEALENACRRSKRVIQASVFHVPLPHNPGASNSLPGRVQPLYRFRVIDHGISCRFAAGASAPLPELQSSAVGEGHVTVYPQPDGALRKIPHVLRYKIGVYPSLALAASAHYLDIPQNRIHAYDGAIQLGTRRIPVDEQGEAWVNWIGANRSFPTYTVLDVLNDSEKNPKTAIDFKDCLVLIGVTAAGAYERQATPFSPNQPAVELQANAIDNILTNHTLSAADSRTANA